MEPGDYVIKLADKEDIEGLSHMICRTSENLGYVWSNETEEEKIKTLRRLMLLEGNRFSHKNFKIIKNKKEIIGFFLGFEGRKLKFKTIKSNIMLFRLQKGLKNKLKYAIFIMKYIFYMECLFNEYYLSNIFIKEEYRGLGYSCVLLEEVLNEAILNKYNKVVVRINNKKLANYYKKFGYKFAKSDGFKMVLKI
ncbi:GNAT family N-acetyltransferase [uncultured Clostridium sp.]|uniref:GNAT family N-acetyltransferase n=1 Tax=uncultured Clostridium sp. TaxID=59620 RepID=UPI002625A80D|nr:GNAT family N-acetyltransferase [uncultured Clostridium sp.]